MENNIIKFRDGIFSLNTRRFGKVAELMIKKMFNFNESNDIAYDLKTIDNKEIEVKFSRVLKKCNSNINDNNVIESIMQANLNTRILSFEESKKQPFNCNIQQIKATNFKQLYYGCFFKDKIMICKIDAKRIKSDTKILYSDYQHSGNVGEGQFHIENSTIQNHIDNYLIKWLTYEELYQILK